ncbi:MAG: hypothetical protein WBG86_10715 [Polyangiales bacterium]
MDRAYVLGEDRVLDSAKEWISEDNGWSPYCTEVEVHEMPGDHDSMVLEPNVRVMADQLRACIQRAEEQIERPHRASPGDQVAAFAEPERRARSTSN